MPVSSSQSLAYLLTRPALPSSSSANCSGVCGPTPPFPSPTSHTTKMYPSLHGAGQGQAHGPETLPSVYVTPSTLSYARPSHSAITIGASLSCSPASMRIASSGHLVAESGGFPSLPHFSALSAKANLGKTDAHRKDASPYSGFPSPLGVRKSLAAPVAVGPALHSPAASLGRDRLSSPLSPSSSPLPAATAAAATTLLPTAAAPSYAAGSMIGAYMVDRTLGQGSYGKVKLGIHQQTREKVALKFIHKSSIKKETHLTRIRREVRLLRLLSHPNIIKLLHVIETDADIILIMEHAPGGELLDHVQARGRLTEAQARPLFRQILSSVAYIHRHCIIHRDLKPQNLLLDATRTAIKLVDFGFANTFEPKGLLGTFCGSPYYAAPEMVSGTRYTGPEVDVWSLGVILYSMLTGTVPFNDESVKGLYAKILAGHYEMPSELSSQAKDLIQSMMVVDRRARPSVESLLGHCWVADGWQKAELHHNRAWPFSAPLMGLSLDERIVSKLRDYQIDPGLAQHQILREPTGRAASIYALLLEKMKMEEAQRSNRKRQLCCHDSMPRQLVSEAHARLLRGVSSSKVRKSSHPVSSGSSASSSAHGPGFAIPERILSEDEIEPLADVGIWAAAAASGPLSPLALAPLSVAASPITSNNPPVAIDFYYQPTMQAFSSQRPFAHPAALCGDKSLSEPNPTTKSGFSWLFKFGKGGRDKKKIHPCK